jgi:glycosyltransferase involved in cell wall biosynthesis
MKVLLVHNYYQQPGGEDQVFATEAALLEAHGHSVVRYTVHNDQVAEMNPLSLVQTTLWNKTVYRELRALICRERPQGAHFHNTFPLISPAAYYAAKAEGVPVVQTLHNYRLLCPSQGGFFLRQGKVCEDCLGQFLPWPGIVHSCYRNSKAGTAVHVMMLSWHRAVQTWTKMVDVYIALTEFAQQKFIQGGLPAEKMVVKPNFVYPDPSSGEGQGGYALFVGRLSPEKGTDTLLAAWERLDGKVPLKIVGDGPLSLQVDKAVQRLPEVEWLGRLPKTQVLTLMKDAHVLIFPSLWYEGFPMVIAEAFAVGLPVVASELGSMSSLIAPGRTGLHFRPGNPEDLAAQVEWTLKHPAELAQMRREARAEFEAKYTAAQNYQMLMEIYERVVG